MGNLYRVTSPNLVENFDFKSTILIVTWCREVEGIPLKKIPMSQNSTPYKSRDEPQFCVKINCRTFYKVYQVYKKFLQTPYLLIILSDPVTPFPSSFISEVSTGSYRLFYSPCPIVSGTLHLPQRTLFLFGRLFSSVHVGHRRLLFRIGSSPFLLRSVSGLVTRITSGMT